MVDITSLEESSKYNKEFDTYGDVYKDSYKAYTARDNIRLHHKLTKQQIYKAEHPSTWDIELAITHNDDIKKFGEGTYKIRYVVIYPQDEGLKEVAVIPLFGVHDETTKESFWCVSMVKPLKEENNRLCEYLYSEKMALGVGVINNKIINGAETYRIKRDFLVMHMGTLDTNNMWKVRGVESWADTEKEYKQNGY